MPSLTQHFQLRVPAPQGKRVLDLLGSALLLAMLLVPLLLATGLLYATQRDGAFEREPAAGLAGRPYRAWRFRIGKGSRIGAALERCALDGLPQLINVLRGEMSLVGPTPGNCASGRPERLLVRPGMTGLWQVSARSDLPWEEMDLLDRHYVENHWLGMDLAILAQTPRAAWRHRRP